METSIIGLIGQFFTFVTGIEPDPQIKLANEIHKQNMRCYRWLKNHPNVSIADHCNAEFTSGTAAQQQARIAEVTQMLGRK